MAVNTTARAAALILIICAATTTQVSAAVPTTTTIDGALTSAGGGAAADGTYAITFSLYAGAGAKSPVWQESNVKVIVKGGRFSYPLGSTKALSASQLSGLAQAWLGVAIGTDPELPRQRVHATAYALVAQQAKGLACTGCVSAGAIANGGVSAAKVGFSYAGSTTKGGPAADLACTGCVSVKELKFDSNVDLGANSLKAKNGTFTESITASLVTANSFIGDGSKLTGLKMPKGACAQAGEVVKGINPDGTLKCIKAMDPTALPKDGLNEISNDLISNQFVDTVAASKDNIAIPDNQGKDAVSNLTFPNIGTAQKFALTVHVVNTDLSALSLVVLPPNDKKTGWTLCDPCGAKDTKIYKKTFNPTAKPKSGDIGAWIGQNPKGLWNLKALDTSFCVVQAPGNAKYCDVNKKTDGSIVTWNIEIQTLSNQKIAVKGDQYSSGDVNIAKNLNTSGDATIKGNLQVDGLVSSGAGGLNGNFKYVLINKDWRNKGSGWTKIPNRTLSYTKMRKNSIIRVNYQDTLGTLGSNYAQCSWRIMIDKTQVAVFSDADISGLSGYWRMKNSSHMALGVGFKEGVHTITVESLRNGAQECLMGWNTSGNFLSAEEVGQ